MEHTRYQSRVEEGLSINQRGRRDQVRLMLLIKEADQDGRLEQFANDIDLALRTTKGYLDAYAGYVERCLMPEYFSDADHVSFNDEVVHEIWNDVYDYTAHAQRYGGVDREGITEAAEEMGLKGFGKAMDIAKNTKSMTAAIIGDERTADAALDAVFLRMKADPEFKSAAQDRMLDVWTKETHPKEGDEKPTVPVDEAASKLFDKFDFMARKVYDFEVPDDLLPLYLERAHRTRERVNQTITVMEGRLSLTEM